MVAMVDEAVAMVTKLETNGNRFKIVQVQLDIELKEDANINKTRERKTCIQLYSQGKSTREIAKEARMSFRDIGVILNKVVKKENEGLKEAIRQQDNNNIDAEKNQEQQRQHTILINPSIQTLLRR